MSDSHIGVGCRVNSLEIWAVWCEQPSPYCSFARHSVWKMVIQTDHLLITIPTAQMGVAKTYEPKSPMNLTFSNHHDECVICTTINNL